MKIERIEISHKKIALDPPFYAAWDNRPRTQFTTTIIRVFTDEGHVGIGSGDVMAGFDAYQELFLGTNPLDIERHYQIIDNISFHAGRCWPLDIALWDLIGKIKQKPIYQLLGAKTDRILAYASLGTHSSPEETVQKALKLREMGFLAMKIRFGRPNIREDLKVLEVVRKEVGSNMQIMVDCNQGWRMPWDTRPSWKLPQAVEVAKTAEELGVFWLEEPLHRGDYEGMAKLGQLTRIKIAGGEMTREPYEFHELMNHHCLDVLQPDAVVTCGITGLAKIAAEASARGLIFSPHTWGNGIGLMANLHLTAGTVGTPFIEYPFDPPQWTPERRDFVLSRTIDIDENGYLVLPDAPGLGIELA